VKDSLVALLRLLDAAAESQQPSLRTGPEFPGTAQDDWPSSVMLAELVESRSLPANAFCGNLVSHWSLVDI